MKLGNSFLRRIENPQSSGLAQLNEQALSNVRAKFDQKDIEVDSETLRKSTYTYYHNWETESPKFGFFLQNPGTLKARHEGRDLLEASEPLEYVDVYQRYAAEWFINKNEHFAGRFFPFLDELGLIDVHDWKSYVQDSFFDDFYMTDLVKYRVTTGDIQDQHRIESFDEQMKHELEEIDVRLVFAFSSRLWKTLYENISLDPISEGVPLTRSVSECHGFLYKAGNPLNCYVIPLSHYSRQIYGHYLRDSYFDYLKDGLTDYISK